MILDWIYRRWPKPFAAIVFTVFVVLWLLDRRTRPRTIVERAGRLKDDIMDDIARGLIDDA